MVNPILARTQAEAPPASLKAIIDKSLLLVAICATVGVLYWQLIKRNLVDGLILHGLGWPLLFTPFIAAILAHAILQRPARARALAVPFALSMGVFLGGVCGVAEQTLDGIVAQSILFTFVTFVGALAAFKIGLIRPTDLFIKGVVCVVAIAVAVVKIDGLLVILIGSYQSQILTRTPLSLGLSFIVAVLGACSLLIDFRELSEENRRRSPDWYYAFGTVFSLVWIYLAVFFLLARLRGQK